VLVFFAQGWNAMKDWVFVLDLGVIACGFTEIIMDFFIPEGELADRIGILRLLRLGRVIRLLQLLRKTRALRELQKLVTMMSTCLKALAWSFIFCFVVMTIWAMLIVELVNPLIQEMHSNSTTFADCPQCPRATRSVMDANLLLFKTVIAGDSWGTIAVPVIEAYPATAIIWVGSLLTLVFGVLNLIVAVVDAGSVVAKCWEVPAQEDQWLAPRKQVRPNHVVLSSSTPIQIQDQWLAPRKQVRPNHVVVDTFADARDRDILNLAEEMEQDMEADKRFLQMVFNRIDVDKTGQLTLDQLVEGARTDTEFQSRLRVMDIDEMDLVQLFEMIDIDNSGSIEQNEFIRPLSRWVRDSKTAPRFIKYNMMRTMHKQDEIQFQQNELREMVETRFSEICDRLDQLPLHLQQHLTTTASRDGAAEPRFLPRDATQPLEPVNLSSEDADKVVDIVEQPHSSEKVTLKKLADSQASVQHAMERLESLVLHATEAALKESTDSVKRLVLDLCDLKKLPEEPPSRNDGPHLALPLPGAQPRSPGHGTPPEPPKQRRSSAPDIVQTPSAVLCSGQVT